MKRKYNIRNLYTPVQPSVKMTDEGVSYIELSPDVRLQEYIYCYWNLKTLQPLDDVYKYRVVSDGCIDVFFDLPDCKEIHTPGKEAEISFLLPGHPSQQPLFQSPFVGQGVYLTIEVDDVDTVYETMKQRNVPIEIELRDEMWGDRHFAIKDPNGIGIDIVTYSPQ